jgi:anti-sigma regulatory factor (Ser/Thr protein kinase)
LSSVAAIPSSTELVIRPVDDDVRPASDWLAQSCESQGVPAPQILRLDLCLNEVLANVIAHGGPQALACPVWLRFEVAGDAKTRQASVTVRDSGAPFDATAAPLRPRPLTLDEAEPGGLGLLMMRKLSDALSYRHDHGRNELTFSVRWDLP